jgi:TolB protein
MIVGPGGAAPRPGGSDETQIAGLSRGRPAAAAAPAYRPPPGPPPAPAARRSLPGWALPAGIGCGLLLCLAVVAGGSALAFLPNLFRGPATATVEVAQGLPTRPASTLAPATQPPEPEATEGPAATLAPVATEAPAATEPPPPTDAPLPTDTPPPTDTPVPTETAVPIGGGRIAFISNRDGQYFQVYTMNPDGSDVRALTTDPVNKFDPGWYFGGTLLAWNADGTRLIYTAGSATDADLWVINADGTGVTPITSGPGMDFGPAWCADGSVWFGSDRINYILQVFRTTVELGAAGERPTNFSATHNSPREWDPEPYPGCQRALFTSSLGGAKEIWRYWPDCPACFRVVRSAKAEAGDVEEASLSPDGQWLAYARLLDGRWEVLAGSLDDPATDAPLTQDGQSRSPAWSPDGQWLAYSSWSAGMYDIWIVPAGGGEGVNLTPDGAFDLSPAWQPAP